MSLMEMIKASKSNTDLEEWSNLPKKADGTSLLANRILDDSDMNVNCKNINTNLFLKLDNRSDFWCLLDRLVLSVSEMVMG